jgi:hypothetical protein
VDVSVRVGNALFFAGAIALIWFAAKRATGATKSSRDGFATPHVDC